jgi:hypothetical protein
MQKLVKFVLTHLYYFRSRQNLKAKIKSILKNINSQNSTNESHKKEYLEFWREIDPHANFDWFKAYSSINENYDKHYVSEITYYNIIEPTLNNVIFAEAYSDKNNYHRFINKSYLPKILLRCIQGVFMDEDYQGITDLELHFKNILQNHEKVVCKKTIETGGGADVEILKKSDRGFLDKQNNIIKIDELERRFGQSFLIQEYIEQHPFFSQYNPSSVNTIRIFTYRSVVDNQVHILHSVFRIGKKGAMVDNQASGGISCGINTSTVILNNFAIDKYGSKHLESNQIGFSGQEVPKYGQMKEIAHEIAYLFPYHRLLGFDFAFDKNEKIRLVEVNNRNNEINFYQMNNGSLFGDFTQEVIQYCNRNKKQFKIDFEI